MKRSIIVLLGFFISSLSVSQSNSVNPQFDNLKIAFVSYRTGSADIFLMNPDGSEVEQITSSPENNSFPYQIDERTIGFTQSDTLGNSQILKIDIYTKVVEEIGSSPRREGSKWEEITPSGAHMAFVRSNDYSDRELYIYDYHKKVEKKITDKEKKSFTALSVGYSWSPDEKQLLFMSGPDWYNQYIRIYDLNKDTILTVTERGYMNSGIRWLNDNKTIIANLKINGETKYEIFSIDSATGKLNALTTGINLHPDVSPDGEWIVFESQRHLNYGEVYIMRKDGSEQQRLTNNPDYNGRCIWFEL